MSSYEENKYGDVLAAMIRAYQPVHGVELGVLDGYSAYHIGKTMKAIRCGRLDCYDLFEEYKFKHGDINDVRGMLSVAGLDEFVKVQKDDAFKVHDLYADNSLSLLHVDISNTGETVKKIMEVWDSKMVHGAIIIFEGGSQERDKVEWMVKYNMPPIKEEIENNKIINGKYVYGTYLKFPSMTMLLKKRME